MKKLIKIAAVLLVIVLLLIGIGTIALRVLLPPEKAKALVEKQLTTHLKREVQMGDVSVSLLTGMDVSDLKISEAPNFSRGTFISSDHFSIRLSLLPLLFRKVEVSQLTLRHPAIQVIRYADGKTFNFSDLMASASPPAAPPAKHAGLFEIPDAFAASTPAEAAPAAGEPSFSLVVSVAQIQDGVIHFVDQSPAKQSADIKALNLKLKDVSLTSPFSVQTDLTVQSKGVQADLQLAGQADLPSGSFTIKKCELSSGGSTLVLSGEAQQLKTSKPVVNLQLDVKEFKLAAFAPFLPLPKELTLNGPILANAKVKGDQQKMTLTALLDLSKVQLVYGKQFSKAAQVPMGVSLSGQLVDLQTMDLDQLKATLGSLEMKAHGKIQEVTSSQPQINLHIESNAFPPAELAGYLSTALPRDLAIKGTAQMAADISGTLTSSHIAAKLEGKELGITLPDRFMKNPGTALRASVLGEIVQPPARKGSTAERTVNFQSLEVVLGPAIFSGKGSVQTAGNAMKFQLGVKSNAWAIQDLAPMIPATAAYHPAGNVTMDVRASGVPDAPVANGSLTLQNVAAQYQQSQLTQLAGTINFTQQDVAIPKLTGKLNGSDFSIALTGHRLTTQPDITVEANLAQLDLDKILPAPTEPSKSTASLAPTLSLQGRGSKGEGWLPLVSEAWAAPPPGAEAFPGPMKTAGHLTIGHIKQEFYDASALDFKWNLSNITPDLARITGLANLKQGPGQLKDVEKLTERSKTVRLALLPLTTLQKIDKGGFLKAVGLPSLQTIPFDGIRGDYIFTSGVMEIHTFELVGRDLNLSTQGTIGLAGTQPIDLHVTMKLTAGLLGGTLGQLVSDSSGRATLGFTAKGTATHPQIHLDIREATQKALQQAGQQLLQGLGLGGGSSTPAPASSDSNAAPPQQPSQQQKAVDDVQKALKNIFR